MSKALLDGFGGSLGQSRAGAHLDGSVGGKQVPPGSQPFLRTTRGHIYPREVCLSSKLEDYPLSAIGSYFLFP